MPAYLYCDCCYSQRITLDDPEAMAGKVIHCRSRLTRMEVKVERFQHFDPVYYLEHIIGEKEKPALPTDSGPRRLGEPISQEQDQL